MKFNFLHKILYIKIHYHHHHHVITSIIIIFCILTYRNIVSSYCNMSFCNISYLNICIFRGIFSGSTGNMSGASISNSCFTVLLPGHGLVLISFSTGQRDEHHAAFFIRQPQDQNWFIHRQETHTQTHTAYTESTFIACEVKRRMKRKRDVLQRDEEVPTVIRQGLYLVLAAVRGGAAQRGAQEHEEQREHLRETTVQNRDWNRRGTGFNISIRLRLFNIYKYGCSGREKNPSGPKVSFVIKLVCENLTFYKYK